MFRRVLSVVAAVFTIIPLVEAQAPEGEEEAASRSLPAFGKLVPVRVAVEERNGRFEQNDVVVTIESSRFPEKQAKEIASAKANHANVASSSLAAEKVIQAILDTQPPKDLR